MPLYEKLVRPLLFLGDPERMHDRAIRAASWASAHPAFLSPPEACCDDILQTRAGGIEFRNPFGLAAGFDKNGRAVSAWAALGFGHVEIGSVSADFSAGNPKPRLFRIPYDQGIVVHYGLPNEGAEAVAARLSGASLPVPLGINIVNTNRGPGAPPESDEDVVADYVRSCRALLPHAAYLVLNLSCPNTADGRGFLAEPCRLRLLLQAVGALQPAKPVFLKVAPFRDIAQMETFLDTVEAARFVSGFSTNLPPGKPPGLRTPEDQLRRMPGAVSGRPAQARALHMVGELYRRMDRRRYSIIASGGVFCAADAYSFIREGASLVQLLTALVYSGPRVVQRLSRDLARLLVDDGFRSVSAAVGVDASH